MRGALVIALCATGCFSDRGVVIEVDVGGTGATSVELYLGTDNCDSKDSTKFACAGIAPPPGTSLPLSGAVWFRDALLPYTAEVKGRTATFQLRADTPTTIPIVIAVGLTADGTGVGTATLTKLDVSVHGARVNTTTLSPAKKVVPGDSTSATEDRVLVWKKMTPASSCVVVEHWNAGNADRAFVVPTDDPDCDDVAKPECDPIAWHGTLLAGSAATPDCFSPSTSGASACVLGSRGCRDDDPQNTTMCAPQRDRVCVPEAFCAGTSCGRFEESCLRTLFMNDMLSRIDCDVPTLQTPELNLCPEHSGLIDLSSHYPIGQCDQQPKISSLLLDGFDTNADFGGATMELQSPKPACQFNVQWSSGTRSTSSLTDYGLIQLPSQQGALLIPIVFHFYPNMCGIKPFHCTVTPTTDSLWSCAP